MKREIRIPIQEKLERVRAELDLDFQTFGSRLDLTESAYRRFIADPTSPISKLPLGRLAEETGLTSHFFDADNLDFRAELHHLHSERALPKQYLNKSTSRLRSVISILDGVEDLFNWRLRKSILKNVGLSEGMLKSPLQECSIQLGEDICNSLIEDHGFSSERLFWLGAYSSVTYQDSPESQVLKTASAPSDIYERIFPDLISKFERHHSFRVLSKSEESIHVALVPRPESVDLNGSHRFGGSVMCEIRAGVIASLPAYLGHGIAHINKMSCVHWGAPYCSYEIELDHLNRSWKNKAHSLESACS